jgi:hypothetical protein
MEATEKQKEYMKLYAQRKEVKIRRKEYMKNYHKTYEETNKDKISKRKKEQYKNNKEQMDKKHNEWKKNNKDKWNKYKIEYYNKNKDKIIAYGYRWEKDMKIKSIEFRIMKSLRDRLKEAFRKYSKFGKIMTSREYGIDYKLIIEHLKPFPKDRNLYHIDHIKPLCSFDLTNPEEVKKAMAPDNFRWLLAKDNLHKISEDRKMSIRNNYNKL